MHLFNTYQTYCVIIVIKLLIYSIFTLLQTSELLNKEKKGEKNKQKYARGLFEDEHVGLQDQKHVH